MISEGHKQNFATLASALRAGDLALVYTRRVSDQSEVVLICAMQVNEDQTITPIPIAEMIGGNPFELYEDPTAPILKYKETPA